MVAFNVPAPGLMMFDYCLIAPELVSPSLHSERRAAAKRTRKFTEWFYGPARGLFSTIIQSGGMNVWRITPAVIYRESSGSFLSTVFVFV